jgi:uncharacterized phiE125 gp8 family phage protein
MTLAEMRQIVGLPDDATDAQVVAAYAALIDDGVPSSVTLVEPVTAEMVREQCRLDDDEPDILILQKIRAAREWVEDYTGRIIAQQTLVQHFASFAAYLELHARPVVSVDAIAYNGADADGIYSGALYSLGAYPLRIFPSAAGFPSLRAGGGVTVAFTAGYEAGEVPRSMIEAILVLCAGMMSNRQGAYNTSLAAAKQLVERLRTQVI